MTREERIKKMKHLFVPCPDSDKKICTICNAAVLAPYDHIEAIHLRIEYAYGCYYCDMTLKSSNARRQHIFRFHRKRTN